MNEMEPLDPRTSWPSPATSSPAPQVTAPHSVGAYQPVSVPVHGVHSYGAVPATLITDRRDPGGAIVAIAWIAAVCTLGYMLPWAIAATRGRSNQAAIGVIDLLLAWTLVGWIVALVMACQAHQVVGGGGASTFLMAQQVATMSPPAGWYPSPYGAGQQYWDGGSWTGHRAP